MRLISLPCEACSYQMEHCSHSGIPKIHHKKNVSNSNKNSDSRVVEAKVDRSKEAKTDLLLWKDPFSIKHCCTCG